jgi:putative hydrolase of the HAD superfamily
MFDPVAFIRSHSFPMEPIPTGVEPRLRSLAGIRAVAFDIYGTLFLSGAGGLDDSAPSSEEESLRQALLRAGLIPTRADISLIEDFRQKIRHHQEVRRSGGITHPEVEIRAVWRDWLADAAASGLIRGDISGPDLPERLCLDFECAAHPVWPLPGIAETLGSLREAGMPLGLVSNAQFYTPPLFPALVGHETAFLGFSADLTVYSYLLGEAKPSARLFQILAESLAVRGIPPGGTLYVGNDMRNDIAPAAAVGFRTALYAGDARSLRPRRDDPEMARVIPDLVVTDLRQIPACLG